MMNDFFSRTIEAWYQENRRDLPWRNTRDPYKVWISEIILQQTRVAQGLDYYRRFIGRFPTVEELAAAAEDEVLRYWQGLGYYSRARNLHAAAKSIVATGGFPTQYKEVRALKGVGDYTAAAICSIAYHLPYAVVDGNVYRVLSRYLAIETPIDSVSGKKLFAGVAQQMLDTRQPALYNQAIMDFGALQCVPKSPDCAVCPLNGACVAVEQGRVAELPVKQHKTTVSDRYFHYIYIRIGDSVLLHQRRDKDIWRNLYEVPLIETDRAVEDDELAATSSWKELLSLFGNTVPVLRCLRKEVRHVLSHRVIHASFWSMECEEDLTLESCRDYFWVRREELDKYAVSRLISLLFEEI